jgi:UDP-N-acetylmuramyl pentapeptide phosphotransferase/UDP-N-acetylglucosamine-1-phosphate transferase
MLDARRRPPTTTDDGWRDPTNDPAVERRIRQLALPLALGLAFLVMHSGLRGIARVFLTMWVHESGHAVTAWLCGFGAFPGPWRTPVSEGRLAVVIVAVAAAIGYAGFRAWNARARGVLVGLGALLLVQLVLTFGIRAHDARALIIFMGDGGCLVLGTLLMATLYVAPGSALHRGWLRWGFLVIGAFAFMDAFATWWQAKHSAEGVVFGEIEGVGDSDPTRLVFDYGWREAKLVSRYLALAWGGLLFLGALYLVQLRRPEAR